MLGDVIVWKSPEAQSSLFYVKTRCLINSRLFRQSVLHYQEIFTLAVSFWNLMIANWWVLFPAIWGTVGFFVFFFLVDISCRLFNSVGVIRILLYTKVLLGILCVFQIYVCAFSIVINLYNSYFIKNVKECIQTTNRDYHSEFNCKFRLLVRYQQCRY